MLLVDIFLFNLTPFYSFCCLHLTLRAYLSSIEESRVDKIEWDNWELLFIELPISKEDRRSKWNKNDNTNK